MCNDAYIDEEPGENELMDYAYNGPDNPDQEEANFYFVLHEFKDLVERYGAKRVVRSLDADTEDALFWYYQFNKATYEPEQEFPF